jgi:plasmid stabilization system protein ParE
MRYKVGFTDGALQDVREAQAWYEDKELGLGARFSDAIARHAKSLETMPNKYRIARDDIHLCSVPKFPFEFYYRIEGSSVVILVVHPVRQDPQKLSKKFNR